MLVGRDVPGAPRILLGELFCLLRDKMFAVGRDARPYQMFAVGRDARPYQRRKNWFTFRRKNPYSAPEPLLTAVGPEHFNFESPIRHER